MDTLVKNAEDHLLTGYDVLRIADNKTKIMLYEDLKNYNNIDDVLKPFNSVILAYESLDRQGGHWVLLMKNMVGNQYVVEFFDSYGFYPDDEEKLKIYNTQPYLTNLLKTCPYEFVYNDHRLQKKLEDVNTCGRHVACRLRFRDYSLNEYISMMTKNKYDADYMVTILTLLV